MASADCRSATHQGDARHHLIPLLRCPEAMPEREYEADTSHAWKETGGDRSLPFRSSLSADLLAHIPLERRPAGWKRSALAVLRSPGFRLTFLYRVSHLARHRLGLPGRVLAGLLFWWMRHAYGCSIASTARLHGGLILPHPQGIVIGPGIVVGPRAWIYQNVTLGGSPGRAGNPVVGADARIYAGAVIAGPVRVGDNVVVGANAVVANDVPSRKLVRSPQAEVVDLPGRFIVRDESEARA